MEGRFMFQCGGRFVFQIGVGASFLNGGWHPMGGIAFGGGGFRKKLGGGSPPSPPPSHYGKPWDGRYDFIRCKLWIWRLFLSISSPWSWVLVLFSQNCHKLQNYPKASITVIWYLHFSKVWFPFKYSEWSIIFYNWFIAMDNFYAFVINHNLLIQKFCNQSQFTDSEI